MYIKWSFKIFDVWVTASNSYRSLKFNQNLRVSFYKKGVNLTNCCIWKRKNSCAHYHLTLYRGAKQSFSLDSHEYYWSTINRNFTLLAVNFFRKFYINILNWERDGTGAICLKNVYFMIFLHKHDRKFQMLWQLPCMYL